MRGLADSAIAEAHATSFRLHRLSLISRIEMPVHRSHRQRAHIRHVVSDDRTRRATLDRAAAMLDSVRAVVSMRATFPVTAAMTAVTFARKSVIIRSIAALR